jgi:hypothetical protein
MFFSTASIEEFFSKIKIPYGCEFLVVEHLTEEGNREIKLSLLEVYQHQATHALRKYLIAQQTRGGGFMWLQSPLHHRRDLHGMSIRVGVTGQVNSERTFHYLSQIILHSENKFLLFKFV